MSSTQNPTFHSRKLQPSCKLFSISILKKKKSTKNMILNVKFVAPSRRSLLNEIFSSLLIRLDWHL